jgi:hypothetical protein
MLHKSLTHGAAPQFGAAVARLLQSTHRASGSCQQETLSARQRSLRLWSRRPCRACRTALEKNCVSKCRFNHVSAAAKIGAAVVLHAAPSDGGLGRCTAAPEHVCTAVLGTSAASWQAGAVGGVQRLRASARPCVARRRAVLDAPCARAAATRGSESQRALRELCAVSSAATTNKVASEWHAPSCHDTCKLASDAVLVRLPRAARPSATATLTANTPSGAHASIRLVLGGNRMRGRCCKRWRGRQCHVIATSATSRPWRFRCNHTRTGVSGVQS